MRPRIWAAVRLSFILVFALIAVSACQPGGGGSADPEVVETTADPWAARPPAPPRSTSPDSPPPSSGSPPAPLPESSTEAEVPVVEAPAADPPPADPTPVSEPRPAGVEPDTSAIGRAVADAYAVGAANTSAAAVAVLDLQTGQLYGAGDIDETYASASVVKVFIATRLLADGRADDPAVRDRMWKMITVSDDAEGSYLYGLAGGESLVPWIADRYGISGLAPTDRPGFWGLTRITARAMVNFYAAVIADPAVAPWLLDAMDQAQPYGSDGFYQHFGLPSAAASWRVKQGWMCCLEDLSRMHSTGYIDNDRYAVALLTAGPPSLYGDAGAQTLTMMAQTLLPDGTLPTS
jgi:hypothetical protein